MTASDPTLGNFPSIEHLVLLRVYGADNTLAAVLPNLAPEQDTLRVVHGVLDRDGRIGREEAQKGLQALQGIDAPTQGTAAQLLERARGGETLRVAAIASTRQWLLELLVTRDGTLQDTDAFIDLLNAGDLRAAEKIGTDWHPQPYVIDGILNYFKVQPNEQLEPGYWDKIPLKNTNRTAAEFEAARVRYAPGSRVRTGCYVGPGTVVMNQAFINIGAYVAGEGVMVDGGARIGSCAQIGQGVKFGAGSGIEGILEPAGRLPSIVEDQAKIGAMCEVSGIIGEGTVIASGVVMASGKKIYDEGSSKVVDPLEVKVGETVYQVPVIPPYRLAVGGSLLSKCGSFATDAIILKPGDLRDRATLQHFERQGILYS